jgi:hypothetical protein
MKTRKILIVTKTYPTISQKYRETVCTAGILLDEDEKPLEWIRIYPVRYRDLEFDQKYPKWGIISASIEKNDKDYRQESYRIDDSSIRILRKIEPGRDWKSRRDFFEPLIFQSLKDIKNRNLSLGVIKPINVKYSYKETDREWPASQQAILDQGDLLRSQQTFAELEKIPYKFYYSFRDNNNDFHNCSIIDWEISQLYRKMRDNSQKKSINEQELDALDKVKIKLADELLKKDLYFLMGNLKSHKNSFVIIGLIYPPTMPYRQLGLFNQ